MNMDVRAVPYRSHVHIHMGILILDTVCGLTGIEAISVMSRLWPGTFVVASARQELSLSLTDELFVILWTVRSSHNTGKSFFCEIISMRFGAFWYILASRTQCPFKLLEALTHILIFFLKWPKNINTT